MPAPALQFRRPSRPHPTRGSGIVMALIFAAVLCAVLASMLRWVMTESTLNKRAMLRLEARNAAEAIAEYGMCQIRYRMENTSTFTANAFTPSGANALTLPAASLFSGTRVDTSANGLAGGRINNVVTSSSAQLYYVDANDPNNINDPLKGKWIFRRDIPIYAKATVTIAGGRPVTAYVCEKISVRGAPLFAHAIFYNMDLELAPGATMNVYGPVHANGDIYVSSQGASVNFYNTVTATGNIYHAWKSYIATAQGQTDGTNGEALNMTSDVTFKTRTNTQVSMDQSGTWKDSTMGVSTTVKNNNVAGTYSSQDAYKAALVAGVTANVNAFKTFASSTWNGNLQTSANGVQNYTPVAIGRYVEDPTPSDGTDQSVNTGRLLIEPPTSSLAGADSYSAEVEQQKYSNQAGVYIQIVPASGTSTTTTTSSGTTTATTTDPLVPAIITVKVGGPTGTIALTLPSTLVKYYPYKQTAVTTSGNTTYTVNRGMYDQRRSMGMDLVELDMAALKEAVAQMQLAAGSRDSSKAIAGLETNKWTGIVYVEITSNPTTKLNGTTVAAAGGDKVGVRLINGNSQVASYGTTDGVMGLTLATNAPVYIKGHYNDDGTSPNASTPKSGETPAAIAADAITLLSPGFNDATSRSAIRPSASANTVVAAAMLTGISPTNKNGSSRMSGGAHNLVRFLENWNGKSVYIRGSLVSLFESRVADEPWKIDYYSAPTRNWGFNDLFLNGHYPPGTPRVISYRRADYGDMTKEQYDTAIAGL